MHIHTCTYKHTDTSRYKHVHLRVQTLISSVNSQIHKPTTHQCKFIHEFTYVRTHTHVRTHARTHAHTHTHSHTHTHTHTHTHIFTYKPNISYRLPKRSVNYLLRCKKANQRIHSSEVSHACILIADWLILDLTPFGTKLYMDLTPFGTKLIFRLHF